MNGPGVREAKIEPAICQHTPGWLIGKPQCSATERPAWFCHGMEAAVAISPHGLGTAWSDGACGWAPPMPFCSTWGPVVCARGISVLRTIIFLWLGNRRSPQGRKGREGLEAGSYLVPPPAWAGEFSSQPTIQLQRLEQRGGSPAGAVAFIQRRS